MKILIISFLFVYNLLADSYGSLLLHGNCTTCHHIEKHISAPSLKLVKQRYMEAFPKKEDFVDYMSKWVLKPKKETSLMVDMIEKYELMPELGYDLDTLEKIIIYIYDNNFN